MRILVLGVSTRAMVESAVRGGHDVVAVDFFGDRDQARLAESYALQRDLGLPPTAEGLAAAARRIDADAIVYGSNLENHPSCVGELAAGRPVLGNSPETVAGVRDWALLRGFCREAGFACPTTVLAGEERGARAERLAEEARAQRRRPRRPPMGRQGARRRPPAPSRGPRSPCVGRVRGRRPAEPCVRRQRAADRVARASAAPASRGAETCFLWTSPPRTPRPCSPRSTRWHRR